MAPTFLRPFAHFPHLQPHARQPHSPDMHMYTYIFDAVCV